MADLSAEDGGANAARHAAAAQLQAAFLAAGCLPLLFQSIAAALAALRAARDAGGLRQLGSLVSAVCCVASGFFCMLKCLPLLFRQLGSPASCGQVVWALMTVCAA